MRIVAIAYRKFEKSVLDHVASLAELDSLGGDCSIFVMGASNDFVQTLRLSVREHYVRVLSGVSTIKSPQRQRGPRLSS